MSTMWQGCLADTDYFEMRSSGGHDYGVWVTTPPGYDPATTRAPVVYVLDGNWAVGMTAPLIVTQADPMQRIQPYIQVSVGYAGEDAQHWDRLRNRDLVPPGESIAKELIDAVEMGVQAGARKPTPTSPNCATPTPMRSWASSPRNCTCGSNATTAQPRAVTAFSATPTADFSASTPGSPAARSSRASERAAPASPVKTVRSSPNSKKWVTGSMPPSCT